MIETNIVFDTSEAAEYLHVHRETVLRMARRKQIPHHKVGRKLLFRKDSLDAWIREQERQSTVIEDQQNNVTFLHRAIGQ